MTPSVTTEITKSINILFKHNDAKDRNPTENATGLRRICKKSDQPKIERPENNDVRLVLRR